MDPSGFLRNMPIVLEPPRFARVKAALEEHPAMAMPSTLPFHEEKTMTRKIILAVAMGGLLLATAACNTVKGAGRDIQSVGQAGSEAIH
jgi:predicted small secreted protein